MTSSRLSLSAVALAVMSLSLAAHADTSTGNATLYGFVQLNGTYEKSPANGSAAYSTLAKQPADSLPAGGVYATARASRLGLKGALMNDAGNYLVEADFGGTPSSGATGGKPPSGTSFQLRHAYLQSGNWLAGQTWTNFYDANSAPEVIDGGSPITNAAIRQAQVRYQLLKNDMTTATVSMETPTGLIAYESKKSSISNGRVTRPDLTFNLTHKQSWGTLSLVGVKNQYVFDSTTDSQTKEGYALGLSGSVKTASGKVVGGLTQGDGAGRYQWGAASQGAIINNGNIMTYQSKGQWLGYQHKLTENTRINASYSVLTFADAPIVTSDSSALNNKQLRQYVLNSFVKVAPGVELGAEWVGGTRLLLSQQVNHESRFNVQMRATF